MESDDEDRNMEANFSSLKCLRESLAKLKQDSKHKDNEQEKTSESVSSCESPGYCSVKKCNHGRFNCGNDHKYHDERTDRKSCEGPHMVDLLEEFNKIYSNRLQRVEQTAFKGNTQEYLVNKIEILESWVRDVSEQNSILVATVEELEREAGDRVALLEEKLTKMAATTKESCINLRDHQVQVLSLVADKVTLEKESQKLTEKILQLELSSSQLQDENNNLYSDLNGLIEVITRARLTGHWDVEDLTFTHVTPEQVFGLVTSPSRSSLSLKEGSQDFVDNYSVGRWRRENCGSFRSSYSNLQDIDSSYCTGKLSEKDASIAKLKNDLKVMQSSQHEANNMIMERDKHIAELQSQLTSLHSKMAETYVQLDRKRSFDEIRKSSWGDPLEGSQKDVLSQLLTPPSSSMKDSNRSSFRSLSEVDGLTKSNKNVEAQLSENIDVITSHLVELEDECQLLKDQYSTLEELHSHCSKTISKLQDQLLKSCQFGSLSKYNKALLDSSEGRCSQATQTMFQEYCLNFVQSKNSSTQKVENELSEKCVLIHELQTHLLKSRQEVSLKDETISKIEKKLGNVRNENLEKDERLQKLCGQLTSLQLELARMHSHSKQLQLQIEAKAELIQKLETDNGNLSKQLNEKSSKSEQLFLQVTEMKCELEKRRKEVMDQKVTISALQDALVSSKQMCDKLRSHISTNFDEEAQTKAIDFWSSVQSSKLDDGKKQILTSIELEVLRKKVETLEDEIEMGTDARKKLSKALSKAIDEKERLQMQLESAERQLKFRKQSCQMRDVGVNTNQSNSSDHFELEHVTLEQHENMQMDDLNNLIFLLKFCSENIKTNTLKFEMLPNVIGKVVQCLSRCNLELDFIKNEKESMTRNAMQQQSMHQQEMENLQCNLQCLTQENILLKTRLETLRSEVLTWQIQCESQDDEIKEIFQKNLGFDGCRNSSLKEISTDLLQKLRQEVEMARQDVVDAQKLHLQAVEGQRSLELKMNSLQTEAVEKDKQIAELQKKCIQLEDEVSLKLKEIAYLKLKSTSGQSTSENKDRVPISSFLANSGKFAKESESCVISRPSPSNLLRKNVAKTIDIVEDYFSKVGTFEYSPHQNSGECVRLIKELWGFYLNSFEEEIRRANGEQKQLKDSSQVLRQELSSNQEEMKFLRNQLKCVDVQLQGTSKARDLLADDIQALVTTVKKWLEEQKTSNLKLASKLGQSAKKIKLLSNEKQFLLEKNSQMQKSNKEMDLAPTQHRFRDASTSSIMPSCFKNASTSTSQTITEIFSNMSSPPQVVSPVLRGLLCSPTPSGFGTTGRIFFTAPMEGPPFEECFRIPSPDLQSRAVRVSNSLAIDHIDKIAEMADSLLETSRQLVNAGSRKPASPVCTSSSLVDLTSQGCEKTLCNSRRTSCSVGNLTSMKTWEQSLSNMEIFGDSPFPSTTCYLGIADQNRLQVKPKGKTCRQLFDKQSIEEEDENRTNCLH